MSYCYNDNCIDNCCNYYGYCPEDYSYFDGSSYYECYTYYANMHFAGNGIGIAVGVSIAGIIIIILIIIACVCYRRRQLWHSSSK